VPSNLPISLANDADLMRRLAAGDKTALGELIKRHQRRVLEIAYRTTGNRATAEEIAQDTFLRVWESATRYRPTARFETWIHRIVVNLCLDAIKKRRPITRETAPSPDPRSPDPPAEVARRERQAAVRDAVSQLPDRFRVVLALHRFAGFQIADVAEATGWSKSAVESLLVRAYRLLREKLKTVAE
jgi:RNA polymerase sigma-70 factor, ECF subfamily